MYRAHRSSRLPSLLLPLTLFATSLVHAQEVIHTRLQSRNLAAQSGNGSSSHMNPFAAGSAAALSQSDGRWQLYLTSASNLDAGWTDANNSQDVVLVDAVLGTRWLVSHAAAAPTSASNGNSTFAVLSGDGRYVAYASESSDLVAGMVRNHALANDTFLFDRSTGENVLVSHRSGQPLQTGNGHATPAAISADGRYVLFNSSATDLDPDVTKTGSLVDVYLYDRVADSVRMLSRGAAGGGGNETSAGVSISSDGTRVVFNSLASNLMAGGSDTNNSYDVFAYDVAAQSLSLVSHAAGQPLQVCLPGFSFAVDVSRDGSRILYNSSCSNLYTGGVDANGITDVFVYDTASGDSRLVSHRQDQVLVAANNLSSGRVLAADGRFVLFESLASNLDPLVSDSNGKFDVFRYDLQDGSLVLVSHAAGNALQTAADDSLALGLSANGRHVLMRSKAIDLVDGISDGNAGYDLYLRDLKLDTAQLISRDAAAPLTCGNAEVLNGQISRDGARIVFSSAASNLDAAVTDANAALDFFATEREALVEQVFADGFEDAVF